MSYSVRPGPTFIRQAKRICKKYPLFAAQLKDYSKLIKKDGAQGVRHDDYPHVYKDRLGLEAYNIGKSGGARILVWFKDTIVSPILIYLKSDIEEPSVDSVKKAKNELLETLKAKDK